MPNVGDAMVDAIAAAGVSRCYTVPGESFLEVLDAAERHPQIRLISTRHEGGASFMAEADAKLTGIPAVATATRGPGASNLAIGVHTAHQDSTPMLVLLGDVESDLAYRGAFQEVDLAAFYAPITKLSIAATRGDRLPDLVSHGLRVATSGRPGPVMIALPADLLAAEHDASGSTASPIIGSRPVPSGDEAAEIIRRLGEAQRPVVIAGGGAQGARADLIEFAERFKTGVYAAFRRQDVFPNDHPLYLGHLGVAPPPETLDELKRADLVVVLGARLNQMTTQDYTLPDPAADVIQIDVEPVSVGAVVPVALGVVADTREALRVLLCASPPSPSDRTWSDGHETFLRSTVVGESRSADGIDPAHVIRAMAEAFPEDTIVTNDAGNFSGFVHRHWLFRHGRSQLAPTNGAMGYAVPAAVAAKLAAPDRSVVGVVGDGGFLMTGQEIETAVRYGAPLTILVLRNGLYGTIAMHQAKTYGRLAGIDIGTVDLATYARGLGADGITVEDPADVEDAMRQAAGADAVTVLDVAFDPDLITTSGRLSEMLGR